jgi:hypothetical protein
LRQKEPCLRILSLKYLFSSFPLVKVRSGPSSPQMWYVVLSVCLSVSYTISPAGNVTSPNWALDGSLRVSW